MTLTIVGAGVVVWASRNLSSRQRWTILAALAVAVLLVSLLVLVYALAVGPDEN